MGRIRAGLRFCGWPELFSLPENLQKKSKKMMTAEKVLKSLVFTTLVPVV
ncbi:hypothetical protein HanHA300_Chr09g0314961 [Helianthus annuus]|nr:hypothetical protein HanHA300_Chr09g0314961 [Helianthus annuus]KAJ0542076.1 hypothetical protein HanHA89_Chr09g0335841 [Helianthus annuus]